MPILTNGDGSGALWVKCTNPNRIYQRMFFAILDILTVTSAHTPRFPGMQVPVDCHRDLVHLRNPAARGD